MDTPIEEIYSQYERFRSCKTREEHADKFLSWLLTYKDDILKKEKKVIIKSYDKGFCQGAGWEKPALYTGEKYIEETFK